tara:strand:+ start:41 stop:622 length:582 start_codon:yes stop_codon:yes gene_type:complete
MKGNHFPNHGYVRCSLPSDLFHSLKKECKIAELNTPLTTGLTTTPGSANHYLMSGKNIQKLFEFLAKTIEKKEFSSFVGCYLNSLKCLSSDLPLFFQAPWINVQESHEYLPKHTHDGVYSYTMWIDLPPTSIFEFQYTTTTGMITDFKLNLTPKDEGDLIIFPSTLPHIVYPFPHKGKKRVSISGNIMLDATK